MRRIGKIIMWVFLSFVVILGLGYALVCSFFASSLASDHWFLAESRSPAHLGTAVFLANADFRGSQTYFFVRDAARPQVSPLRIGGPYITDGPMKMEEAVWSKDGSVMAVRGRFRDQTGNGVSGADVPGWLDAYDFRKHQIVSEGAKRDVRAKEIERLLAERGGAGANRLSVRSETERPVSREEAGTFDTSTAGSK